MTSLSHSLCQGLASSDVPALAAHIMIPVAREKGGAPAVLPTVAGFPFALYLALSESFV